MATEPLIRATALSLSLFCPAIAMAIVSTPVYANPARAEAAFSRTVRRRSRLEEDRPAWTASQIKEAPERYQGNGAFLYRSENPEKVGELCKNSKAAACAMGGFVIGPNPCHPMFAGERLARLLCHEAAHVQGWAPHHPD